MQKESSILKYIHNEKEISKCNVSILESISGLSSSKKKSLSIEKNLVRFPFDMLNISSKSSIDDAIFLYKNNKHIFNIKYLHDLNFNTSDIDSQFVFEKFFSLYNKIIFIENSIDLFSTKIVEQINPVQNKFIFNEIVSYTKNVRKDDLVGLKNKELIKIEPLIVSKKRARAQAILMSIGLFLKEELKKISNNDAYILAKKYFGDFNFCEEGVTDSFLKSLVVLNEECDYIIESVDLNIFKYYNNIVSSNTNCLEDTMGYNKYLLKLKTLDNLFDVDKAKVAHSSVIKTTSVAKNSNFDYGVVFPIKRAGNERMFPFYYKITSCGEDISSLIYSKFSNIRLSNSKSTSQYYKAMFFKNYSYLKSCSEVSSGFMSFYKEINKLSDYSPDDYDVINLYNKHGNFIPIDRDKSCIYISRTRTDGEIMFGAMKCVNIILDDFRSDYFDICSNIEFSIKNRIKSRANKIYSYSD